MTFHSQNQGFQVFIRAIKINVQRNSKGDKRLGSGGTKFNSKVLHDITQCITKPTICLEYQKKKILIKKKVNKVEYI